MNLDTYRESNRNTFPSHEFYQEMLTHINSLDFEDKEMLLGKFNYDDDQIKEAENKGIQHVEGDHDFNRLAWYLYDEKIIDAEIIGKMEVNNFNEWETMPDFKDCLVCGKSFDYRDSREHRHQQDRCKAHLITSMDELEKNPTATLGDISEPLQKQYWSQIVDQTLNDLSNAGVVKQV